MKDRHNSSLPLALLILLALLASLFASLPVALPAQALATPVPEDEEEPDLPNLPKFATAVTVLPNGNLVAADPDYNAGTILNVGAVYLYDGATLKLISTLTGSAREDRVGFGGVVVMQNGDFVVLSPDWDNSAIGDGVAKDAGAVTWCSGVTGCQGSVSSENSLVGSTSEDRVGAAAFALPFGGFVALSPEWDHIQAAGGAVVVNAGAATFCPGGLSVDPTTASERDSERSRSGSLEGCTGPVSAENSLYGSSAGDFIGYAYREKGVVILPDGSYLVRSPFWDNGKAANAGAVTWCDVKGCAGPVTSENSLVGGSTFDHVGYYYKSDGITVLPNGSFLVRSPAWDYVEVDDKGVAVTMTDAGAITWCAGTSPSTTLKDIGTDAERDAERSRSGSLGSCIGVISPANSLTGTALNDLVSERVDILPNGSYLVLTPGWDHRRAGSLAAVDAGALTWCSADQGCAGVIFSENSLIGSAIEDHVGGSYQLLPNGSFLALSPDWNLGEIPDVGAVTWCSGNTPCTGTLSAENSLIGGASSDRVGGSYAPPAGGAVPLPDGSYVVLSPDYDAGGVANVGAVTWCPASGCSGFVTPEISLVGRMVGDRVGFQGATVLPNGSYVVLSPYVDTRTAFDAGAVTWCNPQNCTGVVTAENSLIGSSTDDRVGFQGIVSLPNSSYVVPSPFWDKPKAAYVAMAIDAGAVTWCSGDLEGEHCAGAVSPALSLTGSSDYDRVGTHSVILLPGGSYLVPSPAWDVGWMVDVGALTWCSASSGCQGPISAENSLVGSAVNDRVGFDVRVLPDGSYLALSPDWDLGVAYNAGAVTWCDFSGCTGPVSAENSLIGSAINDQVGNGGVTLLPSGGYIVLSPDWDNHRVKDAGAVTWCAATSPGTTLGESGADPERDAEPNRNVNGGGCTGLVSTENSLVGSTLEDRVGFSMVVLSNGNYVINSPEWDNGNLLDVGAVTWCSGLSGCIGPVSAENSLAGGRSFDRIGFGPHGSQVIAFPDGNYVVISPYWGFGAVDKAGAVTWCSGYDPSTTLRDTGTDTERDTTQRSRSGNIGDCIGLVTAENSLVGSSLQDTAGSGGLVILPNQSFVVLSPLWDNASERDAGAVTWCAGTGPSTTTLRDSTTTSERDVERSRSGCIGPVTVENSLVGSTASDQVGSGGLVVLPNGNYVALSPWWDDGLRVDAGAISVCSGDSSSTALRDTGSDAERSRSGNGGSCLGPVTSDNSLIGGSGSFIE